MEDKKYTNLFILIVICITPLIINPFSLDYFYFSKIFFVYILLAIYSVTSYLIRKNRQIDLKTPDKIIVIYFILLILSTIFSISIERSIWGIPFREEGIYAICTYIIIYYISSKNYTFDKSHIRLFLISSSIVALYGVVQYFGYDPIPRDYIRMNWAGRAFSTMGNPNFLGSYLTLVSPISIFTYMKSKKYIYLLPASIIYLSLLCTMTRGAWVGAFIGFSFLMFFLIKYKYSYKHLVIILVVFIFITLFMNIYSDGNVFGRFLTIGKDIKSVVTQSDKYENAGANRIFIWERVIPLISKKPILGYGLETLDIVFTEAYYDDIINKFGVLYLFDKAHNEYLHIAVSTGIPSLILYLIFVIGIVIKGFKNIKKNPLIIPVLCAVIGYLVQAFFNISVVSVAYIYWMYLGILLNFSLQKNCEVVL